MMWKLRQKFVMTLEKGPDLDEKKSSFWQHSSQLDTEKLQWKDNSKFFDNKNRMLIFLFLGSL